ncbi:MAG TPA: hypothetical protein DCX07_12440 [Phycisphaerales bacterium]|nr:hypothetical protein [Phycisphaerales bacterium]
MTGLDQIPSYLHDWPALLVVAMAMMGLIVGVLTGLFGVSGAFLIPMLNVLLGIPYTLAAGSSLSFTLGNNSGAWARHMRLGNVALKTMTILAGSAVCGTLLGADLHVHLKTVLGVRIFTLLMHGMFLVVLLTSAYLVWRPPTQTSGLSLLQRLPVPPRITIRAAQLRNISLPGLCAVGLAAGTFTGLLGIGGGVLFVPVMLLVVGLTVHQTVGTSLGVVLFGALSGAILYGAKGEASLWIVMPLLIGSSVGIQIGSWLCTRLHAIRIRRYFALLVVGVAVVIAIDLALKLLAW